MDASLERVGRVPVFDRRAERGFLGSAHLGICPFDHSERDRLAPEGAQARPHRDASVFGHQDPRSRDVAERAKVGRERRDMTPEEERCAEGIMGLERRRVRRGAGCKKGVHEWCGSGDGGNGQVMAVVDGGCGRRWWS